MSTSNATSRAHSPKIGSDYTIVHVRASNTGTETTAASTDGALTIDEREEEEDDVGISAEGSSLLQQHAAPGESLGSRIFSCVVTLTLMEKAACRRLPKSLASKHCVHAAVWHHNSASHNAKGSLVMYLVKKTQTSRARGEC